MNFKLEKKFSKIYELKSVSLQSFTVFPGEHGNFVQKKPVNSTDFYFHMEIYSFCQNIEP